ncbi:MAG: hypothetical protein ACOYT4_02985 [Nanoarchaeota archaeon]
MVIAKPEWFQRRKYTGWGLSPKDWRGWLYIGVILAVIFLIQLIPFQNDSIKIVFNMIFAVLIIIDLLDVMFKMKKDEREILHEAKAERNALWAIITVLCFGIAYQISSGIIANNFSVDWVIITALIMGLITKAISNYYYDKRD